MSTLVIIDQFVFRASSGEGQFGDGFDYGRLTLVRGEPLYPPIGGDRDPTGPEIRRPIIPVRRVGSKIESIGRRTSSRVTGYGAGAIPDFRRFQATGPPLTLVVPYNTFRVVRTTTAPGRSAISTELRIVKRRASSNDGPFYVESYEAGAGWLVRGDTLDGFTTQWHVLREDLRIRSSFENDDLRQAVGIAASDDNIFSVDEFGKLRIHRIFGGGTLREIDVPTGATGVVYSRGAVIVLYPERRVEVYNPANGTRIALFNMTRVRTGGRVVDGVFIGAYFDNPPFYSGDIIGAAPDDDTIFPNVGAYEFAYERTLKAGSVGRLQDAVQGRFSAAGLVAGTAIRITDTIRRSLRRPATTRRSTVDLAAVGASAIASTDGLLRDVIARRILETARSAGGIRGIAALASEFRHEVGERLQSLEIITRDRGVPVLATRAPERDISLPDRTYTAVCITPPGADPVRIYATDHQRIYEFDGDGIELRRSVVLTSRATNPNRIGSPRGIEVAGGTVFVSDSSNDVIHAIPRDTLLNFPFSQGFRFRAPADLARVESDPTNIRIWVADQTNRAIQSDFGDGSTDIAVDRSLGLPENLAWFDGRFYVGNGTRVQVYDPDGSRVQDLDFTLNESSAGFAQHGNIFYSLAGNDLLAYTFRRGVIRPVGTRLAGRDDVLATRFQGSRTARRITDSAAWGVWREPRDVLRVAGRAAVSKLAAASTVRGITGAVRRQVWRPARSGGVLGDLVRYLDAFGQDPRTFIKTAEVVIYQTDMERIFTFLRSVERNIQVKNLRVGTIIPGTDSARSARSLVRIPSTAAAAVERVRRRYERVGSTMISITEVVAPNVLRFSNTIVRVVDQVFELAKSAAVLLVHVRVAGSVRRHVARSAADRARVGDLAVVHRVKSAASRTTTRSAAVLRHVIRDGPVMMGLGMARFMGRRRGIEDI